MILTFGGLIGTIVLYVATGLGPLAYASAGLGVLGVIGYLYFRRKAMNTLPDDPTEIMQELSEEVSEAFQAGGEDSPWGEDEIEDMLTPGDDDE